MTALPAATGDIGAIARLLPPFPSVLVKLLGLLRQEEASMDLIGRLLRNDPVLSGHVLALANHVRRLHARSDLADPLAGAQLIGLDRVRRIVLTVGMNRFIGSAPGGEFFFHHSFAVAITTQELALRCGVSADEAYVAGILHDVGQLAFAVLDDRAFQQAYTEASADGRLVEREAAVFGLDHCQLGERLAEHWNLPAEVVLAIRTHHDETGATSPLQAAVSLGETLARALDLPPSARNRVLQVNADALALLELDWNEPDISDCLGRCRARYRHGMGRAGA